MYKLLHLLLRRNYVRYCDDVVRVHKMKGGYMYIEYAGKTLWLQEHFMMQDGIPLPLAYEPLTFNRESVPKMRNEKFNLVSKIVNEAIRDGRWSDNTGVINTEKRTT